MRLDCQVDTLVNNGTLFSARVPKHSSLQPRNVSRILELDVDSTRQIRFRVMRSTNTAALVKYGGNKMQRCPGGSQLLGTV